LVFVADSQTPMRAANLEHLRMIEAELAATGTRLEDLPVVVQYNKRDLDKILPMRDLTSALNRPHWPWFEAVAVESRGVFETFQAISGATLRRIEKDLPEIEPQPATGWLVSRPGGDLGASPSWLPAVVSDPLARLLAF
jgi:GTPase involved in cell partitioning and DNA repair